MVVVLMCVAAVAHGAELKTGDKTYTVEASLPLYVHDTHKAGWTATIWFTDAAKPNALWCVVNDCKGVGVSAVFKAVDSGAQKYAYTIADTPDVLTNMFAGVCIPCTVVRNDGTAFSFHLMMTTYAKKAATAKAPKGRLPNPYVLANTHIEKATWLVYVTCAITVLTIIVIPLSISTLTINATEMAREMQWVFAHLCF